MLSASQLTKLENSLPRLRNTPSPACAPRSTAASAVAASSCAASGSRAAVWVLAAISGSAGAALAAAGSGGVRSSCGRWRGVDRRFRGSVFRLPRFRLRFGQPFALDVLRLFNARQLAAVEVGQPRPCFGQGLAGEFLVERVLPARLIHHNEAIAAVAIGEHEAAFFERGLECLAAVGVFKAIENGGADRPHVGAEAAGFFHLVPLRRARLVVRLPLVAQLAQAEIPFPPSAPLPSAGA